MRNIRIVADSSCDLLSLPRVAFATAPLKILTSEREFIDDHALNVEEMTEYLYQYKGKSKSSCPNVADWLEAFGSADEVFCVTITSGLSGSYNSACSAKQVYESAHEGKRVFVLDSLSAGAEITLVIEKLEELIAQDLPFDEICTRITDYLKGTGLLFLLKSLKNFANNGRVSPIVAKAVGIMGICIVGKASDAGTLEPMHKCRGEKRALEVLTDELASHGFGGGRIRIGHCQNKAAAQDLKKLILSKFPSATVDIHPLRGLCSFYAEKGGILVGFEKR